MANPNKTKLDANQCVVGSYDGVEEANRTVVTSVTDPVISTAAQNLIDGFDGILNAQQVSIVNSIEYAIELNADDGDSIISYHETVIDGSLTVTSNPPIDVTSGVASFKYSACVLYSSVSGAGPAPNPGYAFIEVSPDDTGNASSNWFTLSGNVLAGANADGSIVYPTSTNGVSKTFDFVARRIRIRVPTAGRPTTGLTVNYRLLLRS